MSERDWEEIKRLRVKLDAACRERDEAYAERFALVGEVERLHDEVTGRDHELVAYAAEIERLRDAIDEALVVLDPGHWVHAVLLDALEREPAHDTAHADE